MAKSLLPALLIILTYSIITQAQPDIANPKIKWRFKTDGPIRGTTCISGQNVYFGSSDGKVHAVNKEDGTLRWKTDFDAAIVSSPVLYESALFVIARGGLLFALDSKTGDVLWKVEIKEQLPNNYGNWDYFLPSPAIVDDRVIAGFGDGNLYAFDRTTGKVQWKFATGGRIRATPLIHGDVIYQPSNDGYVYALNTDGKLLWKFETRGASLVSEDFGFDRRSIFTQPVIQENLLVFGSRDGNVYCVDINTHKEKWSFTYGTTWAMAITIHKGSVFVGWSTNDLACALDLQTGKELWKLQAGAHLYTMPLSLDSAVYFGCADGKMYRIEKRTGRQQWTYDIGTEIYSAPVYDEGTMYFGSDDGFLYAVEEGAPPLTAVYQPAEIKGITQYLVVDPRITPYLIEKGFEQLDSAKLYRFLSDRIADKRPSVVVFALPVVPDNILGQAPEKGIVRQFLEAGGKVLWLGDIPNYYQPDGSGGFRRDANAGSQLLDVRFPDPSESGTYYSVATQEGLNWGLPSWISSTNTTVAAEGVIPLAHDEFGRVSAWVKKFNERPGSGFVSFRSWGWNVDIRDEDLGLIHQLAVYQLE